eukprot:TRINITY_DN6845_c0_g1_i3.p1 TRINITY_DN6845_c0_g1~~TRINITY_DN6845_c0_g1_i3.p1  ORF type:complete len:242 (+),score=23.49 TRINITY_DN6845_c0_g1_i3:112-837(+)
MFILSFLFGKQFHWRLHIPMFVLCFGLLNLCFFFGATGKAGLISIFVLVPIIIIIANIILMIKVKHYGGTFWMICSIGLALGIGISSFYYYTMHEYQKREALNIDIKQAPNFIDSDVFTFEDAKVLTSFIGEYQKKELHNQHYSYYYYCVAPIVHTNWTIKESIPAWAYCYTHERECFQAMNDRDKQCMQRWKQLIKAGVRVELSNKEISYAVKDALQEYGLFNSHNAPVLYWNYPSSTVF